MGAGRRDFCQPASARAVKNTSNRKWANCSLGGGAKCGHHGGARPDHQTQAIDGGEKGDHFGGEVFPTIAALLVSLSSCQNGVSSECPGAVKGAPLLDAAKRIGEP